MRDQFVGDVGDYGKYGLLRALARADLALAVIWYKNDEPANAHGRLTQYLDNPDNRICDPLLFDELKKLVSGGRRTIKDVEQSSFGPLTPDFSVSKSHLISYPRQGVCSGCGPQRNNVQGAS